MNCQPTPTDKEVKSAVKSWVESLANPPYFLRTLTLNSFDATECAAIWLFSQGYSTNPGAVGGNFHITPDGWEYRKRQRLGTVLYWATKNWFAVAVAASAFIASVLAILLD